MEWVGGVSNDTCVSSVYVAYTEIVFEYKAPRTVGCLSVPLFYYSH